MRILLFAIVVVADALYCEELNCYEVLGVERSAEKRPIRKAYRKLSLQWHPDKNRDNVDEATKRFIEVSTAYEVLSDEDTRKDYDYFLDHPEEQMVNQYRYYRTRMSKKVDIRVVLAGLAIAATVVQLILQLQGREFNIKMFKKTGDFKKRLNEKINAAKIANRSKKNTSNREEEVRARLGLEKLLIEELDREFGLFPSASLRETIIPQLFFLPRTILRAIRTRKERAQLAVTHADETRRQRLEQAKEDAKNKAQEKARKLRRKNESTERKAAIARQEAKAQRKKDAMAAAALKQKKAIRKHRKRLYQLIRSTDKSIRGGKGNWSMADATVFVSIASLEQLQSITLAADLWSPMDGSSEELLAEKQHLASKQLKSTKDKYEPWTKAEISALAKGMAKYPGGTGKRWELIAKFVSAKCTVHRKQDDCIVCAKKLDRSRQNIASIAATTSKLKSAPIDSDVWTPTQQKELETAITQSDRTLPLKQRLLLISKRVNGKTAKECLARWRKIKEAILRKQRHKT